MLTESALEGFASLDVSVIWDLRRDDEVQNSPSPAHPAFECRRHIPIEPGSTLMLRSSLQDQSQRAEERVRFMIDLTRELARDHHDQYRTLFEHLLNAEAGFLLHCSAGKDRTGFGAALVLAALGVDEDTIMEDYLLTNQADCLRSYMTERMRTYYGYEIDDASLEAVTGVRQEYLVAALEEISRRHGSVVGYLDEIGVDESARRELQARYTR